MDKQYQPTLTEVQDWVLKLYNTCEQTITKAERLEQHKYAVMVQRPQDKKFLVKMLDESSQIRDRKLLSMRNARNSRSIWLPASKRKSGRT